MTIFSLLLSDTEVHLAPGVKVIPQKQVSKLLDLKELQKLVEEEAENYRREVDQECEVLREQARQEGFATGETTWARAISGLEQEAEAIRAEYEQEMVPGVVKAVERIIGTKLKMDHDLIVSIVAQSLRSVIQYRTITIYCRKEDLDLLEKAKPKFRKLLERCETLNVQDRSDIEPGGCIIETEGGIINAQLSSQLAALERAMKRAKDLS